jgi:hypothetical protein
VEGTGTDLNSFFSFSWVKDILNVTRQPQGMSAPGIQPESYKERSRALTELNSYAVTLVMCFWNLKTKSQEEAGMNTWSVKDL